MAEIIQFPKGKGIDPPITLPGLSFEESDRSYHNDPLHKAHSPDCEICKELEKNDNS